MNPIFYTSCIPYYPYDWIQYRARILSGWRYLSQVVSAPRIIPALWRDNPHPFSCRITKSHPRWRRTRTRVRNGQYKPKT